VSYSAQTGKAKLNLILSTEHSFIISKYKKAQTIFIVWAFSYRAHGALTQLL